jgi:hypothetical protein
MLAEKQNSVKDSYYILFKGEAKGHKQLYVRLRAKRYIIAQNSSQGSALALTVVLED